MAEVDISPGGVWKGERGLSPKRHGWVEIGETKPKSSKKWLWDHTVGFGLRWVRDAVADGRSFISEIRREFGIPMQILIFSNYFFVKGIAYVVSNAVGLPLFKEHLGVGAAEHQRAEAFYRLPWALKGVAGILADGFAVLGYPKRTTMIISAALGTSGAVFLTIVPPWKMTPLSASLAIFAVNLQASFNDLWVEGHYTRAMAKKPKTGASLTSFVWLCTTTGMAIASTWVGPALDYVSFNMICLPVIVCCVQQLFIILYPWPFRAWKADGGILCEKWTKIRVFKDKIKREKNIFFCGAGLTIIACGAVGLQLIDDPEQIWGFSYALSAAALLLIGLAKTLPMYLFKPLAYLFLSRFMVPSIGSVLTYWLTAGPECVPGGPNLSWTFQITIVSLVGSLFSVLGVVIFQRYVSRWTFRRAFWITSVIALVTSIFDIALIMRWNVDIFHVPDKVWYFLSDGIIEEVVAMFAFMPSNVLLSRLCPAGLESTVYAILGGVSNFGRTLSKYTGNWLTVKALGIQTTPTQPGGCNFDNLWIAILICSAVMPILPIILTFWLIPNVRMNVHIATTGNSAPGVVQNNDRDGDDESNGRESDEGDDADSVQRSDTDVAAEKRGDVGALGDSTAPPSHTGVGEISITLPDLPDSHEPLGTVDHVSVGGEGKQVLEPNAEGTPRVYDGKEYVNKHYAVDDLGILGGKVSDTAVDEVYRHRKHAVRRHRNDEADRSRNDDIVMAEIPHPYFGSIPIDIPVRFHPNHKDMPGSLRSTNEPGHSWWSSHIPTTHRPTTSMDMKDGIIHLFRHQPRHAAKIKQLMYQRQHKQANNDTIHNFTLTPQRATCHPSIAQTMTDHIDFSHIAPQEQESRAITQEVSTAIPRGNPGTPVSNNFGMGATRTQRESKDHSPTPRFARGLPSQTPSPFGRRTQPPRPYGPHYSAWDDHVVDY